MDSAAAAVARDLRELCRKKGTHPLEALKLQFDQWGKEYNLQPCSYINLGNSHGKTPLHFSAQLRDDGLTEYLLSLRADPNITTVRGHTALIFASGRGRSETVLNLLAAGAKTRIRLVNGDTALSMGSEHGLDTVALSALKEAESQEAGPWLDFTEDKQAIEAQADHIMAKPHCAQWECDVPEPVAEVLKQRAARKDDVKSATQAHVDTIAAALQPLWSQEREFAKTLFSECCKPLNKKRSHGIIRDSLLAVAHTLSKPAELQMFIVTLLRVLAKALSDIFRKSVKEGEQEPKKAKHGKALATSAVLSALKKLGPLSCGLTVETLTVESPPWTTVELLSPPTGVKLVDDAPHLEAILRRLCHADAWGTDFGTALRWLRMLKPCDQAPLEELNAYRILCSAFVDGATEACRAGHSLKRHLRDNSSFVDEVHEVLEGIDLAGLHEAYEANLTTTIRNKIHACNTEEIQAVPSLGPPYLDLPPSTNIVWVGDTASWCNAEAEIKASKLAAIDTEWWDVGSGPALIQIAVGRQDSGLTCFLIDTWIDNGSAATREFRSIVALGVERLFSSPELQMVGWSFNEDAKRLNELCGGECCSSTFSVLDLQRISAAAVPTSSKNGCTEGLAVTCARFLGKPLDKTEQCSDWRQRPLTDTQRCYAALDAVVLLELHSVLTELLEDGSVM